ncbi:hypothetical protein [Bradyrhizobium sp. USDA 4454]
MIAVGMITIARVVGNMIGADHATCRDDMPVPPSSSICMSSGLRGDRSGLGSLIDMSTKLLSFGGRTQVRCLPSSLAA